MLPEAMKRRVVKHGEATLTISLPAKWVKKVGIRPRTEVEVREEGNNLVVSADRQEPHLSAEIDVKNFQKIGFRHIIAYYRKGYDEVTIRYSNPPYYRRIEQCLAEELIGFEIVKQAKDSCVVKDVSGTKLEEFDTLLRRLWLIIKSITETCEEVICKNERDLALSIATMDKTVNKFSNYCIRILIKRGHKNYKNIPLLYRLLRGLEELSDQYKYFAELHAKRKVNADKTTIDLLRRLNRNYERFYHVFYKYEPQILEELFLSTADILRKTNEVYEQKKPHQYMRYVANINEKMRTLLSSIIEYHAEKK